MYTGYFQLRALPFELTTDPEHLYLPAGHREALSNLEYGLSAAKALTVLLGEPGTGKTTLLRAALRSERCRDVRCRVISNPALTRTEFVSALAHAFALRADAASSKAVLLYDLERELRERRAAGEIAALVVDEAHVLTADILEEIRLLSNIESDGFKLLPLVLAGQSELGARLDEPPLRQIKQRVALRCELGAFHLQETAGYIAARVWAVGGKPEALFTQEAVQTIHQASRGIARTINVIADNALVTAMALDRRTVDAVIVRDVCRDFGFNAPEALSPTRGYVEEHAGGAASGETTAHATHAVPAKARLGQSLRMKMFHSPKRSQGASQP
jgi:general secretion pathway protein A